MNALGDELADSHHLDRRHGVSPSITSSPAGLAGATAMRGTLKSKRYMREQ